MSAPLHATLIAYRHPGGWRGVLLRGPSGAGKSELALRLIGRGWRLVADDRVIVWPSGGRLWGRAPEVLQGLLEVRTVGVMAVASLAFAQIVQVIDCAAEDRSLERTPAPTSTLLCGVDLPIIALEAHGCTAPDKVMAFCCSQWL